MTLGQVVEREEARHKAPVVLDLVEPVDRHAQPPNVRRVQPRRELERAVLLPPDLPDALLLARVVAHADRDPLHEELHVMLADGPHQDLGQLRRGHHREAHVHEDGLYRAD
uniref:(northern house mosquito) hypothetical protein n=1 Tax=Culex pipiens TaxID=7175 RepID=A0A8D8FRC9_CULPI